MPAQAIIRALEVKSNAPFVCEALPLPSLTVENYVKAIYQICLEQEGKPAATGQLAAALRVSPGTVTSMLKTLSESSLATYTPYEGVALTDAGVGLALRVIRRHRLIELFLVKTLSNWRRDNHEILIPSCSSATYCSR